MRTHRSTAATLLVALALPALVAAKPAPTSPRPAPADQPHVAISLQASPVPTGELVNVDLRVLTAPRGSDVPVGALALLLRPIGGPPDWSTVRTIAAPGGPIAFPAGAPGHYHLYATYTGGGDSFRDARSQTLNLWVTEQACGRDTDLQIWQTGAAGPGALAAPTTGEWTFTITVRNCTPNDVTDAIKVQGGANGWAPLVDVDPISVSAGTFVATRPTKSDRVNRTITWTLPGLDRGTSATLAATVGGSIPAGASCWQGDASTALVDPDAPASYLRFISGPWSAAYLDIDGVAHKPYTDGGAWRSFLVVTC